MNSRLLGLLVLFVSIGCGAPTVPRDALTTVGKPSLSSPGEALPPQSGPAMASPQSAPPQAVPEAPAVQLPAVGSANLATAVPLARPFYPAAAVYGYVHTAGLTALVVVVSSAPDICSLLASRSRRPNQMDFQLEFFVGSGAPTLLAAPLLVGTYPVGVYADKGNLVVAHLHPFDATCAEAGSPWVALSGAATLSSLALAPGAPPQTVVGDLRMHLEMAANSVVAANLAFNANYCAAVATAFAEPSLVRTGIGPLACVVAK